MHALGTDTDEQNKTLENVLLRLCVRFLQGSNLWSWNCPIIALWKHNILSIIQNLFTSWCSVILLRQAPDHLYSSINRPVERCTVISQTSYLISCTYIHHYRSNSSPHYSHFHYLDAHYCGSHEVHHFLHSDYLPCYDLPQNEVH